MKIGLNKCGFGCLEIKYHSFKVNEKGLQIDDEKIQSILELPKPQNNKQFQRLIRMTSWYRRFIPYFAKIIERLNRLLNNNRKILHSESNKVKR